MPLKPRFAPAPSTNRPSVPSVNVEPARPPRAPEMTIDTITMRAMSMPWARAKRGLAPTMRSS